MSYPCAICGGPHTTGYCTQQQPQPQTYTVWPGMVAGHCGKCGAPYTYDPIAGTTQARYIPTCVCWNIG